MSRIEVVRLDFVENVLETNDHRVLPIAHLFDALGRQTRDHRNAVLCVAGTTGNWLGVKLRKFSRTSLQ
jgi:hypothetical protein